MKSWVTSGADADGLGRTGLGFPNDPARVVARDDGHPVVHFPVVTVEVARGERREQGVVHNGWIKAYRA